MYPKAAQAIKNSKVLIVTAGAGMGVDSGLPDFRGNQGFWRAYPPYEKLGISFIDAANPANFKRDPAFAWGFYGHRLHMYRNTEPHPGFHLLLKWINEYTLDYFVVTSNVDGHFQKAEFAEDKVYEVHGSIHYLQCITPCTPQIWDNEETIEIDHSTMRALNVPQCLNCGNTARPNILMFGDFSFIGNRTARQEDKFEEFIKEHRKNPMTVIEIGAGTAIPTIRHLSEQLGRKYNALVIRINPREYQIPEQHLSFACGALEGLQEIDKALKEI